MYAIKSAVGPALFGHSLLSLLSTVVAFGGSDGKKAQNGVHFCQTKNGKVEWTIPALPPSAPRPEPRYFHTAAMVSLEMVIFGGRDERKRVHGDIWSFDTIGNSWKELAAYGDCPSPRYSHAMVAVNQKLYVYGGVTEKSPVATNELHLYNVLEQTWARLECSGDKPPGLAEACLLSRGDGTLLLYGGHSGDSKPLWNDLYILTLSSLEWKKVAVDGSALQGQSRVTLCRYGASYAVLPGTWSQASSDMLLFNSEHFVFTQIRMDEPTAAQRSLSDSSTVLEHYAAVIVLLPTRLLVCGGRAPPNDHRTGLGLDIGIGQSSGGGDGSANDECYSIHGLIFSQDTLAKYRLKKASRMILAQSGFLALGRQTVASSLPSSDTPPPAIAVPKLEISTPSPSVLAPPPEINSLRTTRRPSLADIVIFSSGKVSAKKLDPDIIDAVVPAIVTIVIGDYGLPGQTLRKSLAGRNYDSDEDQAPLSPGLKRIVESSSDILSTAAASILASGPGLSPARVPSVFGKQLHFKIFTPKGSPILGPLASPFTRSAINLSNSAIEKQGSSEKNHFMSKLPALGFCDIADQVFDDSDSSSEDEDDLHDFGGLGLQRNLSQPLVFSSSRVGQRPSGQVNSSTLKPRIPALPRSSSQTLLPHITSYPSSSSKASARHVSSPWPTSQAAAPSAASLISSFEFPVPRRNAGESLDQLDRLATEFSAVLRKPLLKIDSLIPRLQEPIENAPKLQFIVADDSILVIPAARRTRFATILKSVSSSKIQPISSSYAQSLLTRQAHQRSSPSPNIGNHAMSKATSKLDALIREDNASASILPSAQPYTIHGKRAVVPFGNSRVKPMTGSEDMPRSNSFGR